MGEGWGQQADRLELTLFTVQQTNFPAVRSAVRLRVATSYGATGKHKLASVRSFVYEGIVCLREGIVATRNFTGTCHTCRGPCTEKMHKAHEVLRTAGAFNKDCIGITSRSVMARRPVDGGTSVTLAWLGDA